MDILEPGLDASSQDKTNDSTESDDQSHLVVQPDGESLNYAVGQVPNVADGEEHGAIAVANQAITIDPTVQYQFRTDTPQGQVTYRVVQVAQDGETTGGQVVTTNAFAGAQAVIQSPFSNGGSPTPDGLATGETKFAYVPANAGGEPIVTAQAGDAQLSQVTTAGGQFYVMMSPQDVLQGQRTIAPRTQIVSPKLETTGPRSTRDERRRATHNEVERRRRDKINNWIMQLSKLVPDCGQELAKAGQSKGGILAKACDYITELRSANARMAETLKETERLAVDVELLRQQCDELKHENSILRATISQHGIVVPDLTNSNS